MAFWGRDYCTRDLSPGLTLQHDRINEEIAGMCLDDSLHESLPITNCQHCYPYMKFLLIPDIPLGLFSVFK